MNIFYFDNYTGRNLTTSSEVCYRVTTPKTGRNLKTTWKNLLPPNLSIRFLRNDDKFLPGYTELYNPHNLEPKLRMSRVISTCVPALARYGASFVFTQHRVMVEHRFKSLWLYSFSNCTKADCR